MVEPTALDRVRLNVSFGSCVVSPQTVMVMFLVKSVALSPAVLVIETGANDGLRGLSPDSLKANIQTIIDSARALSPPPRVVLVGMRAPPNYGFAYARRFSRVYRDVADENDIPLVPFLLQGVAARDGMNQADGIHPTAAGQRRMAETVWEVLEEELK